MSRSRHSIWTPTTVAVTGGAALVFAAAVGGVGYLLVNEGLTAYNRNAHEQECREDAERMSRPPADNGREYNIPQGCYVR